MNWLGLANFKGKFEQVFKEHVAESTQPIDNFVRVLLLEFLKKKDSGSHFSKQEFKALRDKFVAEENTTGPIESRKKIVSIIKYIMLFCGMLERVRPAEATLGYAWVFPDDVKNEKDYFEQRKLQSNIDFKKEPPRA